jgi:LmbE family N-acetylglucosaminyl deacetylase
VRASSGHLVSLELQNRMIQPLVSEEEWLEALRALPVWDPPPAPALVIAPHPDDETLGAGGWIAAQRLRGVDIVVAAVTDGERAYGETPGLAEARRLEQNEALARLGVPSEKIVRLGLPDSDVTTWESELAERLAPLISAKTHVIAPWKGDCHPDHQACGRAAEQVARQAGATLTSYFFWTWHLARVEDLRGLPLCRFPLTADLLRAKAEALSCHRSQLQHESSEPVLPELLLGPAQRPFEVFATA